MAGPSLEFGGNSIYKLCKVEIKLFAPQLRESSLDTTDCKAGNGWIILNTKSGYLKSAHTLNSKLCTHDSPKNVDGACVECSNSSLPCVVESPLGNRSVDVFYPPTILVTVSDTAGSRNG
jgi:hypothetical protein